MNSIVPVQCLAPLGPAPISLADGKITSLFCFWLPSVRAPLILSPSFVLFPKFAELACTNALAWE